MKTGINHKSHLELSSITEQLLLNGTLTKCPGLLYGKVGIAIFFFHYARYTQNTLYANYAMDLIEISLQQLHANYRADYEKGIAGIGVGLGYLIEKGFLDFVEDTFEDLDERMYRAVWYDPCSNFSQYQGLIGYEKYWIMRLRQTPSSIQAQNCLQRITERVEMEIQEISSEEWLDVYRSFCDLQTYSDLDISSELFERSRQEAHVLGGVASKQTLDLNQTEETSSMGILGPAGKGLKLLTALEAINGDWETLI